MRSFFQNKHWTLFLAVIALAALTALAVGLRNVSFDVAQPIGWHEAKPQGNLFPGLAGTFEDVSVASQLLFWGAVAVAVILIGLLLSPEGRRWLIRLVVRLFVIYWLVYILLTKYSDRLSILEDVSPGSPSAIRPGEMNSGVPPPVFIPPQQTLWISYAVSILIVLFLVFAAWRIVVFWRQFKRAVDAEKPLGEIAKIARSSLRGLTQAGDTTEVIMNCYFRMSAVVSDKRRLHRMDSMTPAEFATRLERAGLPGDAVQRLTRLFEGVRYGGYRSAQKDVNEAVDCLTAILNYCGEPV